MAKEGRVIKAKPVNSPQSDESQIDDSYYMLCYFYPQYTLQDATELPYHQVLALIKMAQRQLAIHYAELTNIASASPTTKKSGAAYKKLMSNYKERARG